MKRLLSVILTLIIVLLASMRTYAQQSLINIPSQCEAFLPSDVEKPMSLDSLISFAHNGYGQIISTHANEYWDVYSDRSENTTFIIPDSNSVNAYSSLGFGERVRIAKIINDYALVYSIPEGDIVYPALVSEDDYLEWKGWIPMTNLILSNHAVSAKFGESVRVIMIDDRLEKGVDYLSYAAYCEPKSETICHSIPFCTNSVYYLLKQEENMMLLSQTPKVSTSEELVGWVNQSDVIKWEGRIALQPTWDEESISFFFNSDVNYDIIDSRDASVFRGRVSYTDNSLSMFLLENFKVFSGKWSFPLIQSFDNEYEVAIPSTCSLLSQPSSPIYSPDENGNYHLVNEEIKDKINLFFVLDGSRNYESVFPIISNKLDTLQYVFGNDYDLKIGALIYHDVRNSKHKMEFHQLSSSTDPSLFDFIDGGGQYGFRDNLSDAPVLESLDYVIENACFSPLAKNIIIIIGGRGDSSDHVSPEELAIGMADLNLSVFGIQLQNDSRIASYRSFGYLLDDIVYSTVSARLKKNGFSAANQQRSTFSDGIRAIDYISSESKFPDGFCGVSSGVMTEHQMDKCINNVIERIVQMDDIVHEPSEVPYNQLFLSCRVPKSLDNRFFYKEVALFSENEFEEMMALFADFAALKTDNNLDRGLLAKLFNSKLELVKNYNPKLFINGEVNQWVARDYSIPQLFAQILGITNSSRGLIGKKIKDILSKRTVDDVEYMKILEGLSKKYEDLKQIKQNRAQSEIIINGDTYYWVPIENII